jgi:RNA polymerase sigma factor (sigma-70 family)
MTRAIATGRVHEWVSVTEAPRDLSPDGQAMEALAQGDRRGALSILMKAYGEAIYRYCHKVLRNRALTDDVHQLVFIQAFEDMGTLSGSRGFRPWLYAIANHRCLDALKVRRRWFSRFVLGDEAPEELDPAPSGEEQVETHGVAAALDACLAKLKPHVRIAVVLRYQEGFSYEEMSRICEERPATLQARVARAMPLLRQCLESKGVFLR